MIDPTPDLVEQLTRIATDASTVAANDRLTMPIRDSAARLADRALALAHSTLDDLTQDVGPEGQPS